MPVSVVKTNLLLFLDDERGMSGSVGGVVRDAFEARE